MCKAVLLTGASGFIGAELLKVLSKQQENVLALVTGDPTNYPTYPGVQYIQCDVFDFHKVEKICKFYTPSGLIHLAWRSTGKFESMENFDFLMATVNLAKSFMLHGGRRLIFAGTYAEYASSEKPLKEGSSRVAPSTTYANCKFLASEILTSMASISNCSYGVAKIFSAYGLENDQRRLSAQIINSLKNERELIIKSGYLTRDYIYVKDVADAIYSFYKSSVVGSVNICSGRGMVLRDYVLTVAKEMGKEHLVKFQDQSSTQPLSIIGDNTRLINEVGFKPTYQLKDGVKDMVRLAYMQK